VKARSGARGAIMFVVAMTLSLLGAMGIYALNMATSEVKASGYLRQNAQTHYVSEWAVMGAAEALTVDAQHLAMAISANSTLPNITTLKMNCPSIAPPIVPATASAAARSCLMLWSTDLLSTSYGSGAGFTPLVGSPTPVFIEPYTAATPSAAVDTTVGDLGLANTAPDFFIEFTDLTPTSPPAGAGSGPGQPPTCSYLVTVTGTGVTPMGGGLASLGAATPVPGGPGSASWTPTEGFEQTRSRIIFGPAPCGY
jgi:hypothetical protein